MGNELPCKVRSGEKTSTGKALLESSEIIFRGDLRLKIPLQSLHSVWAHGGELHLRWEEGAAVFELGDHAERWAHKILHPKSTADKLGIKPGLIVSVMGMDDTNLLATLRSTAKSFSETKPLKASDLIFLKAESMKQLVPVKTLAASLSSVGALWIVYPKGRQEIKEQNVLDTGRQAGLVDVRVVSFSSTHTALKFVRSKAKRPGHPSKPRA